MRLLLLLVGLVLPGLPAAWAETLVVGFGSYKPPYIFETGNTGLEYEIVVAVAREAGLTVQPFFAPQERLHQMLAEGGIDALTTTSEQSGVKAFYSQPYIRYHNFAVTLAERRIVLRNVADLGRYSVSSFQRARSLLGPDFQAMTVANPLYREEPQQLRRNQQLMGGRVDVIVGDRRIIQYHLKHEMAGQPGMGKPLAWHELFAPTNYRMGFRNAAQRDRFDAALATLRKRGDYAAIEQRYASF